MQTIFSTSDVEPRYRYDYWHSIACQRIINHDSVPVHRDDFRADLKCGTLGEIEFVQFENSPMSVTHRLDHVADADAGFLYICRQAVGRLSLQQNGQSVVLGSGDLVLLEPRLPYTASFADDSRMLVAKVPRAVMTDRLKNYRELIGRAIRGAPGKVAMTSIFMAMLPNHVGRRGPAASQLATDYLLKMFGLSTMLGRREQPPNPPTL
jgi:AraC family transcriptional activator of tynA and feaB